MLFCKRRRLSDPAGEDTRCARRATRELDEFDGIRTQGSPRGLGQPWAEFFDTFGVVSVPRCARKKIAIEIRKQNLAGGA